MLPSQCRWDRRPVARWEMASGADNQRWGREAIISLPWGESISIEHLEARLRMEEEDWD
jgi:hypothetical protein